MGNASSVAIVLCDIAVNFKHYEFKRSRSFSGLGQRSFGLNIIN